MKGEGPAPKPIGPTELDALEAEIASREAEIAELERQLADDWSNVEMLAAHRQARDELQSLLHAGKPSSSARRRENRPFPSVAGPAWAR